MKTAAHCTPRRDRKRTSPTQNRRHPTHLRRARPSMRRPLHRLVATWSRRRRPIHLQCCQKPRDHQNTIRLDRIRNLMSLLTCVSGSSIGTEGQSSDVLSPARNGFHSFPSGRHTQTLPDAENASLNHASISCMKVVHASHIALATTRDSDSGMLLVHVARCVRISDSDSRALFVLVARCVRPCATSLTTR